MQNTAFNSRAFRCPAFEPMFPLVGGVESAYSVGFDGTNDYISVGDTGMPTGAADRTVSMWVKTTTTSETYFLSYGTNDTGKRYSLGVNVAGEAGKFGVEINGTSLRGGIINNGMWHHVCSIMSSGTHAIYIDGILKSSAALATNTTLSGTLYIGRNIVGLYFPGRIDDLRIYNRALSADEISSIYANTSSPPTSGLVCYFPLDEGTGTTTTDTVGGLIGTLTNGPTWQPQVCPRLRSGRDTTQSWGVSLVGASSHYVVSTSSPLNPSATNFTASAWVKFTGVATQQVILSQLDGSGTGATWLELTSGAKLQTAIGGSNLTGATSLVANVWYHVALQQSGTTSTLYVNGTADGTATRTPASASGVIRIGTSKAGANYMTGTVKSVRIDQSAISAPDIAKLANNQSITATPVGHWKLDDGTGTTATDSSGNGNNGTLTNGPTWTGDIPQWFRPTIESSYALSCDGSNDYVSVASAIVSAAPCTLMCWFNSSSVAADQTLLSLGQSANETNYFALRAAGAVASDPIQAVASSLSEAAAASASGYTASAWHHAAGVFASTTSRTAYLNGVAGTANTTSKTPASLDATAIGRLTKQTPSEYAAASIDEACVYSRALTAAEIADAAAGYLVSAGIVSRWKLDGNANDSHGSNHGTAQGVVGYSTSVPGTL